jgi:hypothetical protein
MAGMFEEENMLAAKSTKVRSWFISHFSMHLFQHRMLSRFAACYACADAAALASVLSIVYERHQEEQSTSGHCQWRRRG